MARMDRSGQAVAEVQKHNDADTKQCSHLHPGGEPSPRKSHASAQTPIAGTRTCAVGCQ